MRLWRKRKRCVSHMLARRRSSLGFSKVYCDFTKRWLLAWNQNKHITYYILHVLIPKSVLVLFTFDPTSSDDTNWIIARLSSIICRHTFRSVPLFDVPYVNYFGVITVFELQTLQIPEHFYFQAVLLTHLAWSKLSNL